MSEPKPLIKFEDFARMDIRVGNVLTAVELEESDKLIKLEVDFGEMGKRQIIAGIKAWYKPKDLIGRQLVFIVNIEPRKMMGFESQGMVLAADSEDGVAVLFPEKEVKNGTSIK